MDDPSSVGLAQCDARQSPHVVADGVSPADTEMVSGTTPPTEPTARPTAGAVAGPDDVEHPPNAIFGRIFCLRYSLNLRVFIASGLIIWGFVIWCMVDENAEEYIADLQRAIVEHFSWLFIGAVCSFILFMVYLMLHPTFGDIKLGRPDEEPKYSVLSWYAMLFSAMYSPSLYFYGVAETVLHFRDSVEGRNAYSGLSLQAQAKAAVNMSWFHLGLAGLSIYCVVGLNISFLANRHGFPITMRTCLYPIIGHHIHGVIGDVVDTSAVVATMFGLATSLGLGVMQINAGLSFIFDVENSLETQIVIIWIITLIATVSVTTGVDRGIKFLSQTNFAITCFVLLWLFFAGDTFFLLNLFVETAGYHFQTLPKLYAQTDSFEQIGYDDDSDYAEWMQNWTVFYWGWWIAFSPFVGTFIAQISRGRTVRVFLLGNLSIPAVSTAIWLTIMGGLGAKMEFAAMALGLGDELCDDDECDSKCNDSWTEGTITRLSCAPTEEMLFRLLSHYPFSVPVSLLCIMGITGYFVTSSDSASFVIDMITSGGMQDPPKMQRVFWALSEGAAATALLAVGGSSALTALQTASIASAFPFTILLCIMVYSLVLAFEMDEELLSRRQKELPEANGCDAVGAPSAEKIESGDAVRKNVAERWALGLFDGVCSAKRMKLTLQGLLCPCTLQFGNGRSVGLYAGEMTADSCRDVVFLFGVFVFPLTILVSVIAGFWVEGLHILAAVVWVAFVVLGATHRMKVRTKFNLKGSFPTDVVSYACCYCLALGQETLQCELTATI